jgi:TetR/AcrR family transcriptional regulator, transcriptional repressor of bet genes
VTPTRGARRRRGRPRLASPEARRHQILDAAVRQLANTGDRSVTIDSIAKEAGLVRAQIYEIFSSRDGLFEAALEREASRINDYLLVARRRAFELPLPERVRARRTFEEPGWDPDAIVEFLAIFSLGGFAALMDAPDEARAVDAPKSHEPTPHHPAD